MSDPYFSIVMAAYNRGDHIRPSIESVLRQSNGDFELLVVGDACRDDTERAVRSFGSPRITWRNLKKNSGGQSAPNNEGIRRARGQWICYIGHDDIWRPDHLHRFRQAIDADAAADFVVGGCIWHGPPDSETDYITGLFESSDAAFQHLFPPSSIGHRRDVSARIGGWRAPRSIRAPADCEFMLRAAQAGLRFVCTGRISVHKFAAGHRYLSYLRPGCAEQTEMLRRMQRGDRTWIRGIVARAKRRERFMTMQYVDFAINKIGYAFEHSRRNKGLIRPSLQALAGTTIVRQTNEPRGLDWHPRETAESRYRWSGPSPHPKILVPYTGARARFGIEVVPHAAVPSLYSVSIRVEGREVSHVVEKREDGSRWLAFDADLKPSEETILTLNTPAMFSPGDLYGTNDRRRLGIPVADMVIEPL
jgi:glycosyltransferase involved in cell wall biosynthesis